MDVKDRPLVVKDTSNWLFSCIYTKAESTKHSLLYQPKLVRFTTPDAFVEIVFYLFTDFFSSQLHTKGKILLYGFPNFSSLRFAPVLHRVMHTIICS